MPPRPLTGEQLDGGRLDPVEGLQDARGGVGGCARRAAGGAAFFGCRYCGDARCPHPEECQKTFESQTKRDAAYGAAVRRRAWFEGNVLPPRSALCSPGQRAPARS